MGVYIFVATLLFFFAFFRPKESQIWIFMIIVAAILILFDGLRWENGTDWLQYQTYFDRCLYQDDDRYERGYVFINKFIRSITSEYSVFLLLHATFLYCVLSYYFKNYSVSPLLSFFLFFTLFLGYQGMNRQYLALCFGYIAIAFLLKNNIKLFLLNVFIGTFFHTSVVMLLVALVSRKFLSARFYIITSIIAITLSLSNIVDYVVNFGVNFFAGNIAAYFEMYSEKDIINEVSGFSLLMAYARRLIIIIPFLFLKDKIEEKYRAPYALFYNLYFIAFILYILFGGTILDIIVSRGNVYFFFFECVLLPYVVMKSIRRYPRTMVYLVLFIYGLIMLDRGISRYDSLPKNPFIPYKSIYYNTDVDKYTD